MNPILSCLTTSDRSLLLSVPEKFSGLKKVMMPPGLERNDSYRYLTFQKKNNVIILKRNLILQIKQLNFI